VSEQAAGGNLSVVAPPKVSGLTLEKVASVAAAAAAEKAAVAAAKYARILNGTEQQAEQGHSEPQEVAANAAGMAAEAATVAAGAAKTALKSGLPPKPKAGRAPAQQAQAQASAQASAQQAQAQPPSKRAASQSKRAVALQQSAAHRHEAGLDYASITQGSIGAAASALSASEARADSSTAAAATQLAAAASKLEQAQMAQAAMRNKAVAAEAKKVEQAVIAEALAAAADKPARHKETETEVAKLKTITRKLLGERAALEGKLHAAEVSLRQTDEYAKELASARKAELASALVQKGQAAAQPAQPAQPAQSQPPPANRAGSTHAEQKLLRKGRRQGRKAREQLAQVADLSSGIWTDPDGAAVGGATVELLPTAPLVSQVVRQLDPKHAGLNRPQSKPTAKADAGAPDAARALAERELIERPERPPSLQQAQEKEMRSRVVGGLTRIGCTNATNDYIVARDEEEARTLARTLNPRPNPYPNPITRTRTPTPTRTRTRTLTLTPTLTLTRTLTPALTLRRRWPSWRARASACSSPPSRCARRTSR